VTGTALDYTKVAAAIEALELGVDTAEFHGGVCGLLCTRGPGAVSAWLRESAIDAKLQSADANTAKENLHDAEAETWRLLSGLGLEFYPLLPDADEPALRERVAALALWCHGFVTGLGLGGLTLDTALPGSEDGDGQAPLAEIVADFTEISRVVVSPDELKNSAQAGFDLAEVIEYVRVGVQLAFEELRARRKAAELGTVPITRH
jgi:uncharacterized protein YgfB (UPF0149 family)